MDEQEFGVGVAIGLALEARLSELELRAQWIEAAWNHPGPVARRLVQLLWRALTERGFTLLH